MKAALCWFLLGVAALAATRLGLDARLCAVGLFGLAGLSTLKGSLDEDESEDQPPPPPRTQAHPPELTSRPAK